MENCPRVVYAVLRVAFEVELKSVGGDDVADFGGAEFVSYWAFYGFEAL